MRTVHASNKFLHGVDAVRRIRRQFRDTDRHCRAEARRTRMTRLGTILALLLSLAACGGGEGGGGSSGQPAPTVQYHPAGTTIPTSGASPGVEAFDQSVMAFMRQWNVPGAVVAVARDGKLLVARGYGYSDFDA